MNFFTKFCSRIKYQPSRIPNFSLRIPAAFVSHSILLECEERERERDLELDLERRREDRPGDELREERSDLEDLEDRRLEVLEYRSGEERREERSLSSSISKRLTRPSAPRLFSATS